LGPESCDIDADCAPYLCNTDGAIRACFTFCVDGSECADTAQCNDGACTEVDSAPYTYVSIVSTSASDESIGANNPGPDVDAIGLARDGTENFSVAILSSAIGEISGGDRSTGAAANVVGAPNDFNGPDRDCALDSATGYFSFGGSGGFVTVSFAAGVDIATGDEILVYELAGGRGNCSNVSAERNDTFDIYIAREGTPAPGTAAQLVGDFDWCRVGSSGPLGGITGVPVNLAFCE
jgi:hypothetical protein